MRFVQLVLAWACGSAYVCRADDAHLGNHMRPGALHAGGGEVGLGIAEQAEPLTRHTSTFRRAAHRLCCYCFHARVRLLPQPPDRP
jgi:hypothetical protein